MALIGSSLDSEFGLLHPALPALLLRSNRRNGPITVRPRASLGEPAPPPRDASGAGASSSGSSNTTPGQGSSNATVRFSLPRPVIYGLGGASAYLAAAKVTKLWPFARKPRPLEQAPPNKVKRVLIMMSLTGGGHKASADAIKAAFQELYGDKYEVVVSDLWVQHTPAPFNRIPETYSFMVNNSLLWRLSYEITQPRLFHRPYFAAIGAFIGESVSSAFDQYNPDLVVSVHPLMQHVPIGVLRRRIKSGRQRPINFATVVTDFTTCHNSWFHTGATRCFVPTKFCGDLGRKMGLKEPQIVQHGLPIRPIFSKKLPSKKALRKKLGLTPGLPTVLLVGGGEGMGKIEATVQEVAARLGAGCQVAVICGRNAKLLARLNSTAYPGPDGLPMKVLAVGFSDNMHEWMAACDVIITKAGPGTIAEALISGLPILLNGNVPCQEEGNIPYVIDNGVGEFETRPPQIAQILQTWLSKANASKFAGMASRAKALGRPEAVYKIAADLAKLADNLDTTYGPARFAPKLQAARGAVRA